MGVSKVNLSNGETLIDLTEDTVDPNTLFDGETAHDASGNKITGTFSLDSEITAQDDLISRIKTALQGKAAVGGGDNGEEVAKLLENTMTELNNSIVTALRTRAFQQCTKLVAVNLPSVTSIGAYGFYQCSGLVTVKLPKLTSVSTQAFYSCTKLKHADCGQLGNIPAQTFNACSALTELILRKTGSICTLSNVNGVNNSPIGKGTGYVYVPELIDSYKAATNWSTLSNQFRPLVETFAELASIDGSVYDRAWVDDEYCVYIYDGSSWTKEV